MAEIHPNRPESRIYSAFLSKDNLLFFLSARSKQELENVFIAKIRDGPLYYIHTSLLQLFWLSVSVDPALMSSLHSLTLFTIAKLPTWFILSTHRVLNYHWLIETWLSSLIWQLLSSPDRSWPIIAYQQFLRRGKVQEPLITLGWDGLVFCRHSEPVLVETKGGGDFIFTVRLSSRRGGPGSYTSLMVRSEGLKLTELDDDM